MNSVLNASKAYKTHNFYQHSNSGYSLFWLAGSVQILLIYTGYTRYAAYRKDYMSGLYFSNTHTKSDTDTLFRECRMSLTWKTRIHFRYQLPWPLQCSLLKEFRASYYIKLNSDLPLRGLQIQRRWNAVGVGPEVQNSKSRYSVTRKETVR